MLDHCHIVHKGGLVLWSRSYTPAPSPVPALIRQGFIEERADNDHWDSDGYAVRWTLANEFGLIFVVAYQRILQLTYPRQLLDNIKRLFTSLYEPTLRLLVDTTTGCVDASKLLAVTTFATSSVSGGCWGACFDGWDDAFSRLLKDVESAASRNKKTWIHAKSDDDVITSDVVATARAAQTPTIEISSATDAESISRNIAALKARHRKPSARMGVGKSSRPGTDSESDLSRPGTPKNVKEARKWDNGKITQKDMDSFDFSDQALSKTETSRNWVDKKSMGKYTTSGMYQVADYGHVDNQKNGEGTTTTGGLFSRLAASIGLTSSKVVLSDQELDPVLASMKEHLMNKNVAREVAVRVCDSVGKSLYGQTVDGSSSSIKGAVKSALESTLVKILTPKSSTDVLLEIQRKRSNKLSTAIGSSNGGTDPFAITFVGVNGVGKSTNLSKVAFWLLQNQVKVLIAACDTFRSGAVEQLRIHVKNLSQLEDTSIGGHHTIGDRVELFERGYGKDAAGIAKDAIQYGKERGFDVVLIDTAGRMQDNEPLMRALAKLVAVNKPDKIIFVGEALVGNEAVDQLTKFDRSLRDFTGSTSGSIARGIDGMILTKFDTIDDKVGAALSMTYVTGQPILFVGTGQTYTDLKGLRVAHIVAALLQE